MILVSNKIMFSLQMFVKVALLRHHEIFGNSFAIDILIIFSDAESDCSIIGNRVVLFCDLHFCNRYDICLMTPGAWLTILLAGFRFLCVL